MGVAPEDNQKTTLQYYQSKVCADTVSLYYVYVSPPHVSKKRKKELVQEGVRVLWM